MIKPTQKVVCITGASRGLGRELAFHFGKKGDFLILAARDKEKLAKTAEQARALGSEVLPIPTDLCQLDTLKHLKETIEAQGLRIDILIHNAADTTSKPFLETSNEEIQSIIQTNVIGPLQLTGLLFPLMNFPNRPIVVMISSLAGYNPNPSQTVYSISKSAVNAIAEALRKELHTHPIHFLNVALPSIGEGKGKIALDVLLNKLDDAIEKRKRELFLTPTSAFLMRVYGALPILKNLGSKLVLL